MGKDCFSYQSGIYMICLLLPFTLEDDRGKYSHFICLIQNNSVQLIQMSSPSWQNMQAAESMSEAVRQKLILFLCTQCSVIIMMIYLGFFCKGNNWQSTTEPKHFISHY